MPTDIVEEARALLTKTAPQGKVTNGADAYLFDMRGPKLLRALADEVDRLRKQAPELRQRESKQLSTVIDIRGCDRCELCEDHQ